MAKVSSIPQSEQGGGASVSDAEVVEAAQILRGAPGSEVEMDEQTAFRVAEGETKSSLARKRTTSAGGRAAEKLAELLGIERENVHTAVRATEHAEGKPVAFAYWLYLDAKGQDALGAIRPKKPKLAELLGVEGEPEDAEEQGEGTPDES